MAARKKKTSRKHPPSKWRWLWRIMASVVTVVVLVVGLYWLWLDYQVRAKFDGAKWSLAARVYARPLELFVGAPIAQRQLLDELEKLGYQRVSELTSPGQVRVVGQRVDLYLRSHKLHGRQQAATKLTVRFTADGVIADLTTDAPLVTLEPMEIGSIYPSSGEDRVLVRLHDIPPLLGEALLAVEDKQFLHHRGISFKGVTRALMANLRSGEIVQGGSTLTQQLVKNMFLTNERSFKRKLVEVMMTLSLEWHYSKAEILEAYLNEVYLGQSGARAIHGFALASEFYFGKNIADLDAHEVALLVGLVKGATFYNPWRNPSRAQDRRDLVLGVLRSEGLLAESDYQTALAQPLGLVESPRSQHAFPGFIDLVKRQLLNQYSAADLESMGLQIYTTLDPHIQAVSEAALINQLELIESGWALEPGMLQGAAVITAVGTGEVVALVGGRDPRFAGFNRALDAQRPIGSLIKPALYLAALQTGDYSLASLISDEPLSLELDRDNVWQPRNFSGIDHGDVPVYLALAKSYNQAAARLGLEVGVAEVADVVSSLGVVADVPRLPAMLLGAVELSALDVTNFYHTIANDGIYTPLRAIRSVYTAQGERLQRFALKPNVAISAENAYLIDFGLQITARQGTGRSLYEQLPSSLSVAGKTGTTNDQRDSWFAGYTGSHVGVIWIGADDNQPMPITGATGALPVWRSIFADVKTNGIARTQPDEIEYYWVDSHSGLLSAENCRGALLLPFVKGTEPRDKASCQSVQPSERSWWQRFWRR